MGGAASGQGSAACSAILGRYSKDVQGIRHLPDDQKQTWWKVYTRAVTLIRAVALRWAWLCTNIKHYSICSHSFISRSRIAFLLDVLASHLIAKTKMNTASSFYLTLNWENFFQSSFKKTRSPHWPLVVVCHNSSWSQIVSHSPASPALKRERTGLCINVYLSFFRNYKYRSLFTE